MTLEAGNLSYEIADVLDMLGIPPPGFTRMETSGGDFVGCTEV